MKSGASSRRQEAKEEVVEGKGYVTSIIQKAEGGANVNRSQGQGQPRSRPR